MRDEDQRALLALAGEAADAAVRAWRYPAGNRTAAARHRARPHFTVVPPDERARRAEAAWQEVMQRDPRAPDLISRDGL